MVKATAWQMCFLHTVWYFIYIKLFSSFSLESSLLSAVKNLPSLQEPQETRVRPLGWKDPLEKGMATHSSILAWRAPWTEEPGRLRSLGSQRVRHDWSDLAHRHSIEEQRYLKRAKAAYCKMICGWRRCPFSFLSFILKYSWFTMLCFRCTAKWFCYTFIYSFSDSFHV